MDPEQPTVQAVLVRGGRYAAVGREDEIRALAAVDAEERDLHGAWAYPGFTDSHMHMLSMAIQASALELNSLRSRGAVLAAVAQRAAELPEGVGIDARGFNEDLWDDRKMLTRQELDAVAPHNPVRLTRVCGHVVIANSPAIENAGICRDTPVPPGGEADIDRGYFAENALDLISPTSDKGIESCKELLFSGMEAAADVGLTCVHTDDFNTAGYSMRTVTAAYQALEKEGRMPVRILQQCALPDDSSWAEFLGAGFHYGYGSDMYRIGARKLYTDGSLGARTAWLSKPYADAPDRTGVPIYSEDEFNRLAAQTHEANMPFVAHAIGDAGVQCVLEGIRYARKNVPGTDDLPDGIIHCQITTPAQLKRIASERVNVYAQPVFTEYDLHICRDRVGSEIEQSSYNWKTLYDAGVCISSGSDCPVEPCDPIKNIYCAVTRMDFDGYPQGGWMPEQRLSVYEAVDCHTVKPAQAADIGDRLGRIKVGYLADMTVLDSDMNAISPEKLMTVKPIYTMVGGALRKCRG